MVLRRSVFPYLRPLSDVLESSTKERLGCGTKVYSGVGVSYGTKVGPLPDFVSRVGATRV